MPHPTFDPLAHRQNKNYPPGIFLKRILWVFAKPLFRFSPRPCYAWRNWLLRRYGAKIGSAVRLYPTVEIAFPWNLEVRDRVTVAWGARLYSLGRITLGNDCMISQYASLCAGSHDYRLANRPLLTPPIAVGAGAWVASEAFIGPGVVIGEQAIIGARAVVFKDVPAHAIAYGNPVRIKDQNKGGTNR